MSFLPIQTDNISIFHHTSQALKWPFYTGLEAISKYNQNVLPHVSSIIIQFFFSNYLFQLVNRSFSPTLLPWAGTKEKWHKNAKWNFFYLNINLKMCLLSKAVNLLRWWQEMGSDSEKEKESLWCKKETSYFKKLYNL